MKLSIIATLLSIFFLSLSVNPPQGSSGAPFDRTCAQSGCHFGSSSITGKISIEGIPAEVKSGEQYDLKVVIKSLQGKAEKAGFQLVVVDKNEVDAGTFSDIDSSATLSTFLDRTYFEHQPSKSFDDLDSVVYTATWTAPDMPQGSEATFYVSGLLANGNNESTQDTYVSASWTTNLTGDQTTSSHDLHRNNLIKIYPNPSTDYIIVDLNNISFKSGIVRLYDSSGSKLLHQAQLKGQHSINVSNLPQSIYWMIMELDGNVITKKIVKLNHI